MAFGLMLKKWGILQKPITTKVKQIKHLLLAIAHLHNFCINERLAHMQTGTFQPRNVEILPYMQLLRDLSADLQFDNLQTQFDCPHSNNRLRMSLEIESLGLQRPH